MRDARAFNELSVLPLNIGLMILTMSCWRFTSAVVKHPEWGGRAGRLQRKLLEMLLTHIKHSCFMQMTR